MTRVCFVVGHEDVPEAFWRVVLPSRHLRAPIVLAGAQGAAEKALSADVLWIHQPTSIASADLAEKAAAKGKTVIVDLSEDPWSRHELDGAYNEHRLAACDRALTAATHLVVTSQALADQLGADEARVIPAVAPLAYLADLATPPALGWWSDGRQKSGWEKIAPELVTIEDTTDVVVYHLGFGHFRPVTGRRNEQGTAGEYVARQTLYMHQADAASSVRVFGAALAECVLSLDCYPAGTYRNTVSDLGILRAAAAGVPTVTTRPDPPPGCVFAPPGEWAAAITTLLTEPGTRRALSLAAREWAGTRTAFDQYERLLQEVA